MVLKKGFTFTHKVLLDLDWGKNRGQLWSDVPKAKMVVTRVSKGWVWYRYAGNAKPSWMMDRTKFTEDYMAGDSNE